MSCAVGTPSMTNLTGPVAAGDLSLEAGCCDDVLIVAGTDFAGPQERGPHRANRHEHSSGFALRRHAAVANF